MSGARELLDADGLERTLRRLASQIAEAHEPNAPLLLLGIRRGGVALCARLAALVGDLEGSPPATGAIDITLYRDDLHTGLEKPSFGSTELPGDLRDRAVVLVDDVLFTGRTVHAALTVLRDYGRPRWVKLAVLVDRGWRELPIQADFVGKVVQTDRADQVVVSAGDRPSASDSVTMQRGRA